MGIVVPFPVTTKPHVVTAFGHSESVTGAENVVQEELRMAQTRDALRLIVEELEALQREVADAIASR
jgi:hypothetical protein